MVHGSLRLWRVRNRDVMMMKRFELSENSMCVCVCIGQHHSSKHVYCDCIPARARQLQMRVNVIALMVSRYCSFINRLVEPAQCFYTWYEKQIQPVTNHRTLRAIKLNGAQQVLDYCTQLKMTQQSWHSPQSTTIMSKLRLVSMQITPLNRHKQH